jgi:hypothetical protein
MLPLGGEEGLKVHIVRENGQNAESHADPQAQSGLGYEIIDCIELARRWCLPESWVRSRVLPRRFRSHSSFAIRQVRAVSMGQSRTELVA